MTAIAVLTITATSASAQDVEVTSEVNGDHCLSVILIVAGSEIVGAIGGCVIDIHSEDDVELAGHVFSIGVHTFDCGHELRARLDENGRDCLTNQVLTSLDCTREPCEHAQTGQIEPWPAEGFEDNGQDFIEIISCLAGNTGNGTICEMDIPFEAIGGGHRYEFNANAHNRHTLGVVPYRCEFTDDWLTEATDPGRDDRSRNHTPLAIHETAGAPCEPRSVGPACVTYGLLTVRFVEPALRPSTTRDGDRLGRS